MTKKDIFRNPKQVLREELKGYVCGTDALLEKSKNIKGSFSDTICYLRRNGNGKS